MTVNGGASDEATSGCSGSAIHSRSCSCSGCLGSDLGNRTGAALLSSLPLYIEESTAVGLFEAIMLSVLRFPFRRIPDN